MNVLLFCMPSRSHIYRFGCWHECSLSIFSSFISLNMTANLRSSISLNFRRRGEEAASVLGNSVDQAGLWSRGFWKGLYVAGSSANDRLELLKTSWDEDRNRVIIMLLLIGTSKAPFQVRSYRLPIRCCLGQGFPRVMNIHEWTKGATTVSWSAFWVVKSRLPCFLGLLRATPILARDPR